MSFDGETVLITGGTAGLGLAIARRFHSEGAQVAVCGRSAGSVRAAEEALGGERVLAMVADVSNPSDVEAFVSAAAQRFGRLDVVVCNAGIQGPIGLVEDTDWADWARTVEINLFGVVLTCRCVAPMMRAQGAGKIIALSGGGATQARPRFSAYAAAKTAVVRFVETLAAELAGSGVEVNVIAPGALNTRMLDEVLAAGPDRTGAEVHAAALRQRAAGGTPLELATDLVAFLAAESGNGITGRLIAARWDDWRHLPDARERLAGSDVYTLRRIVPEDRGWEPS